MALIELSNGNNTLSQFQIKTGLLNMSIRPESNTHRYTYNTRRSIIGNTISISDLI